MRSIGLAWLNEIGPPGTLGSIQHGAQMAMTTVALFLGYEFAYWLDHYLSHRVPILWHFHAVHHSAESLSPLTTFRVHPVDTIVFSNIAGLTLGSILAVLDFLFGGHSADFKIGGTNALLLIGFMLLTTLQHSHFWISFQGIWGKLFISPAHHQIHHSDDPAHFNTNLGSTLAIWDWIFGTLYLPAPKREKLVFGVAGMPQPHGLATTMLRPFSEAARELRRPADHAGSRGAGVQVVREITARFPTLRT